MKKWEILLITYIDDYSLWSFFTSEEFDRLQKVTIEVLIRRGKPTIIYEDNGKIYRSDTLELACTELGIILAHTQPYTPKPKMKIERLFKTIQTRFYPLLISDSVDSIKELNDCFRQWLEVDYHQKSHTSLDDKTTHEVSNLN